MGVWGGFLLTDSGRHTVAIATVPASIVGGCAAGLVFYRVVNGRPQAARVVSATGSLAAGPNLGQECHKPSVCSWGRRQPLRMSEIGWKADANAAVRFSHFLSSLLSHGPARQRNRPVQKMLHAAARVTAMIGFSRRRTSSQGEPTMSNSAFLAFQPPALSYCRSIHPDQRSAHHSYISRLANVCNGVVTGWSAFGSGTLQAAGPLVGSPPTALNVSVWVESGHSWLSWER